MIRLHVIVVWSIYFICFSPGVIFSQSSSIDIDLNTSAKIVNNKVERVVVSGIGKDENSAMLSASKSAIQQVVGMYVVSDIVMKNREIIKDKVLSGSNAYIASFRILEKK